MEQVLSIYKRPNDPLRPVVCMDETPRQLIAETRLPCACSPGQPQRFDYEYVRCGTYTVFMASEPLAGSRFTEVSETKTKVDWARFIESISMRDQLAVQCRRRPYKTQETVSATVAT